MMRSATIIALVPVFVAVLPAGKPIHGATVPLQEQEVKVTMGDFWFKPSSITVTSAPVRFVVKNNGVVAHTFFIEKIKGALIDLVDPGKTGTLRISFKAGKYTAFCDVPGHRDAGMVMTITVQTITVK